ncbi:MAG: TonB family protein [Prevotella sp.]|nr:TonB family protein [Bacteroides sp.]MCM1366379.1 TonB family protein [Prevotella sp.]MCM1436692.1 TonB family protein [Prevotella sp.]
MKKLYMILAGMVLTAFSALAADTPQYPGGETALQKFITENLQYPSMPKEMGIEGTVDVIFTVKADGSIGNIKIAHMIDPDLEQEAIRIVKSMPAWEPAVKDGQPIDSTATVAISFSLSN